MNPIEDDSDSWWDDAVDVARCIPRPEVQLVVCLYDLFQHYTED